MGAIITLTTDFGLSDAYVAAMKGAILSINHEAKIIDICHSIRPMDIAQAAFILSTVHEFFPKRTIHVAVVDPGVGTGRRAVILRTPAADFVAPDNGILSGVLPQRPSEYKGTASRQVELGPGLEAVAITRPEFWRSPVSATFHGRDIFAPVAAHLSLGVPLASFGEAITSLSVLPLPHPYRTPEGALVGQVLHVDNFGNLITSIRASDLPLVKQAVTTEVGGQIIRGISRTYGESEGLLVLIGSSGYLEISRKDGSAAVFLNVVVGDEVRVRL